MRALLPATVLLALLVPPPAAAEEPETDEVERALQFLASQQGPDGRWPRLSSYVVEAAAAAGLDVKRWPDPERSAWAALAPESCPHLSVPAQRQDCEYKLLLRMVHAAGVSGYDPRDIHGIDGVARVRAGFVAGQFGDPTYLNDDVWAILALRAAGEPRADPMVQAAADNILRARSGDGGWSYQMVSTAGDTDVTGAALAALAAAGRDVSRDEEARAFLLAKWRESGGFENGAIGVNVQSTAWAIHAMRLLGVRDNGTASAFIAATSDADGRLGANAFSTVEALVPLAGARYPLAGYAPATLRAPPCHALEPATLGVAAPFTSLRVEWADGATGATRTFDAAGERAYRYHATGPGVSARGEGTLAVLSARPVLPALAPETHVPRHAPVTLDLSAARDPDGRIVLYEVDWGDGNVTDATSHAYPLPGEHSIKVRAKDDAGFWSDARVVRAIVANRPPTLGVPARIAADRIAGVDLAPLAGDPDGDAIALRWSFGAQAGEGAPRFVPRAAGEQPLEVVATDGFGGLTRATVLVDVVNAPPVVSLALVGDEVVANATDPDGAPPRVEWRVDDEPVQAPLRLGVGTFHVVASAIDADGANATAALTVTRAPDEAPAAPVAPRIDGFDAALQNGTLRVSFALAPEAATARVAWRSDVDEGEAEATSPFERALPGATWASAILLVEHEGAQATRASGLLVPPPDAPAPAPTPERAPVVISEDASPGSAPGAGAAPGTAPQSEPAPLEPASLSLPGARRETPAAPLALALALALALRTRGRRGRSA